MRLIVVALGLMVLSPLQVTLTAPGHTPTVNTRWGYAVRATSQGRPVTARITAQIVDPIGGSHFVQFGKTTKNVVNWRFKGEFHDFIIWPRSSRGIPLKLRITVRTATAKKIVAYAVIPRG
jgi:hypothetical protein